MAITYAIFLDLIKLFIMGNDSSIEASNDEVVLVWTLAIYIDFKIIFGEIRRENWSWGSKVIEK